MFLRGGTTVAIVKTYSIALSVALGASLHVAASAQSFKVQCPATTITHPVALPSGTPEPAYSGPSQACTNGACTPTGAVNGAVKCQEISGGDGYMTEADGNQTFMFSFGPLSGLDKIEHGQAGTDYPDEFNQPYCD